MKIKLLVILTILLGSVATATANQRAYGFCTAGGQTISIVGLNGTPEAQSNYPGCTVTVFLTGTTNLATIFKDNLGTALGNPFTGDTITGYWEFYSANGRYDVVLTGAGIPNPGFTFGDILLTDLAGGGGGSPPTGNNGDVQCKNGTAFAPCLGPVVSKTANYTALATDSSTYLVFNGANLTLTLPASPPSPNFFINTANLNSTTLAVSPNGKQLDGTLSSIFIPQNGGVTIFTDGTNYFTQRGLPLSGTGTTTQNTIVLSRNCGIQSNCFPVHADVHYCFGTASTVVNGSNTVQCTTGNFTSADIGKAIWATSGCCGVLANIQGVLILPEGTISSINSGTSVQVSTSGNASATGSVGTNVLIWGTYDDSNISLAEAAGANLVNSACPAYYLPFASMLVKEPHFNNQAFNSACGGVVLPAGPSLGAATDYQEAILGYGPSTSIMTMSPSYDFAACIFTSGSVLSTCNFGSAQILLENFGMYGGGLAATGGHAIYIACPGPGSQFFNVSFSAFAGADTSANGFCFDVSRGSLVTVDGFGHNDIVVIAFGANPSIQSMCFFCFAGDSQGAALVVGAGSTFMAYGDSWGVQAGNFPIWDISGNFTTYSGAFYGHTGSVGNPPAAIVRNGGVLTAYNANLSADFSGCGPTSCDGIDVLSGGQLFLSNTKVRGRGAPSFAVNVAGGGSFFDLGGNNLSSGGGGGLLTGSVFGSSSITGTAQTSGNWSVPAGSGAGQWGTGPSVACPGTLGAAAGDSITQFCTITVGTGTVGANPVVTITFPTPFWTAPGSCDGKMTGGTATLSNFTSGVPTTTSVALTYQGTPAASSTIGLKVSCR